jgi:heme a synthase
LDLAAAVVVIQLISGILTIVTNISIPWAVVHLAIGTALFMIIADTRIILGLTIAKNTGNRGRIKRDNHLASKH